MTRRTLAITAGLAIAAALSVARWNGAQVAAQGQQPASTTPRTDVVGETVTRLADGRWLTVGGTGAEGTAAVWNPTDRRLEPLAGGLTVSRAFHSATLLADGRVLIVGGLHDGTPTAIAEIFDPGLNAFYPLTVVGAASRSEHTATLLTTGDVLIAGGVDATGGQVATERWSVQSSIASVVALPPISRAGHSAELTSAGTVLLNGGRGVDARDNGVLVDPDSGDVSRSQDATTLQRVSAGIAATLPSNGSSDVPLDTVVALRLSAPVASESVSPGALALEAPEGALSVQFVTAEGGRLIFMRPEQTLSPYTTYVVRVQGLASASGEPVLPYLATFRTVAASSAAAADQTDADMWIPDASAARLGWRTNRPPSPWAALPPLSAPPGVTALAGQVLTLDGQPLRGVTLSIADFSDTAETDRTGRFLLIARSAPAGRRVVLEIDGGTASRPGRRFGFFEYGLTLQPGSTNGLGFTIWMPRLDTANSVQIASPTTSEIVVTTPYISGLELHLPPGTTIRDEEGHAVTEVTITPIPADRPPFPLAKNVDVPVYFTIQPGSAYVDTAGPGPKGAWLVYPNYRNAAPGQRGQFYHYDPEEVGWYVYGLGTVTPDGTQAKPDPNTRLYEFTGAMFDTSTSPPNVAPPPGWDPRADPVDPSTGVFVLHKTDLYLPDVIPIALTRTYDSGDGVQRAFGIGGTHPYAMYLWTALKYQEVDLILPEGGKVHYVRTSPGNGFTDATFVHKETASTSASPTRFYKSTIVWNGNGWDLTLSDGTVYVFGDVAPLQAIRDRYGNTLTIAHANGQTGNITQVTSPNGRSIRFTYDGSNRITQATDHTGRTVTYAYSSGKLVSVTDPDSKVTTYSYDANNRLATITDGRSITYLTNTYTNGRVSTQALAHTGATYQFAYTLDGSGKITQTDITDPRGSVERLQFNADHYITSSTAAYGTALARTTTYERQTGSNLVTAIVDPLSRRTEFTYDTSGHVLSESRLAGTAEEVATTYTYEPRYHQLASITDPLSHVWTMSYDTSGRLTGVTDPLSHGTTVSMNSNGLVTQVTDALTHAWQIGYSGADVVSVTNPLGAATTRFLDLAGRPVQVTDPVGRVTTMGYDVLDRVTTITDPIGGQTAFSYDANSNLLSLTDARSHATAYTYDSSDRVDTRTDPLLHAESYVYDGLDHLTQHTDRKGQVTAHTYDALNRLSQVTFNDTSTITYTYDAGDRLIEINDSANGMITRSYDNFDRLTEETTAQGTVTYTYDADGRRATMTVGGQTEVDYAYDDAHRLTSITQGTNVVAFTYDNANRRATLTYPNGIVATYGYDAANQLTGLTYTFGATTLGDLTYTYDAAGRRTQVGGTWARTGLPAALSSATYDAGNRLQTWDATSFSYDLNGNLTGDGTTTYTWNARNQLAGLSGGASASFAYDGVGRRRGKTIGGATTNFLYDARNFVQELTSGGTPTANLLTGLGLDETFTRTDVGGTSTVLTDALGSVLELADAAGTLQTHYTYDPFGSTTASGAASGNTAQFTGRENDGTGLYFNRARFYSPALQRFIAEDPIGLSAGSNLSSYVANAPTAFVDPLGLKPCSSFGRCAGAAAAGASGAGSGRAGGGAGAGSGGAGGSGTGGGGGAGGGGGDDGSGDGGRGRGRGQFSRNRDFRDWLHRNWKPDHLTGGSDEHNPDLSDEDLDEALRQWEQEGQPKRDNRQNWDRTKRDVKEMVDWANSHRNEILITAGAVAVGGVIIVSGGVGGLVIVAAF